jgi:hypothetical protein
MALQSNRKGVIIAMIQALTCHFLKISEYSSILCEIETVTSSNIIQYL